MTKRLPADRRAKEPGQVPALGLDISQFFHFLNQPSGHALVDFENLRVFILLCKPCHADKLVGEDDIGNGSALRIRQVRHAVIAANDIPIDLQPACIVLTKGFRQHRGGGITGIVDSGITLCQFKIDEAPLIFSTNYVAGVGITVDDLSGKIGIEFSEGVQIILAESVGQIERMLRLGQCQSFTVASRSASPTQSSILSSAR